MSFIFTAGEQAKADELNFAGKTYADDIGAANAYIIDPQVDGADAYTSLTAGQMFAVKIANTNTLPSTLQVNGISAKNIYKNVNEELKPGDLKEDQIHTFIYDGLNMQLLTPSSDLTTIFGGDGSDGDLNISSGTTTVDVGGANIFVLNYRSISITGTAKLAFSNPATDGTIVIIKCLRDCTITSSATPAIDLTGMGAAGGLVEDQDGTNAFAILDTGIHYGGAGKRNAVSVGGLIIPDTRYYTTDIDYLLRGITITPGSGGGCGKRDASSTGGDDPSGGAGAGSLYGAGGAGSDSNPGNAAGGASAGGAGGADSTGLGAGTGVGGPGGRGGGALILQVYGTINFTGLIYARGQNGSPGVVGGTNHASGGGGGAGGMVIILYNYLTAASGTIDTAGGAGGAGSNGGAGGAGGASAGGIISKNHYFA